MNKPSAPNEPFLGNNLYQWNSLLLPDNFINNKTKSTPNEQFKTKLLTYLSLKENKTFQQSTSNEQSILVLLVNFIFYFYFEVYCILEVFRNLENLEIFGKLEIFREFCQRFKTLQLSKNLIFSNFFLKSFKTCQIINVFETLVFFQKVDYINFI